MSLDKCLRKIVRFEVGQAGRQDKVVESSIENNYLTAVNEDAILPSFCHSFWAPRKEKGLKFFTFSVFHCRASRLKLSLESAFFCKGREAKEDCENIVITLDLTIGLFPVDSY
jgi:hypothetical protein